MTKFTLIALALFFMVKSVFAANSCDDEKANKLYSQDPAEIQSVLLNCNFTQEQLNPECQGGICRPLIHAALESSVECAKLLVEAGAKINVNGGGVSGDTP